MTELVRDNQLTPDGQRVAKFLTEGFESVFNDRSKNVNAIPGHFKQWGVDVLTMRSHTPAQWLSEHYATGEYVVGLLNAAAQTSATTEKVDTTAGQVNTLAEKLEKLEAMFAEQTRLLTELKAAQKPAKKPKDETAEAE